MGRQNAFILSTFISVVLCAAATLAPAADAGAAAPSSARKTLGAIAVRHEATTISVYQRVTLEVDPPTSPTNPFDAAELRIDARVTPLAPAGAAWSAPGFYYRPYERQLVGGKEVLKPTAEGRWQVRLSFARPGRYQVAVSAQAGERRATATSLTLTVSPADAPGFVRRHATDHRYFVTDRGETWFPLGANVCWGEDKGTFAYDDWLPKYAAAKCNVFRVWLSPHWATFGLNTQRSGYARIDLANAWRLDRVLELAERHGLRIMFCIDSFNILRRAADENYGQFEEAVYCKANGGPLESPADYFTSETAQAAYRNRLRYIVARWGYSPNVFAWELWNEVDLTSDFDDEPVATWHRRMGRLLRELDPWRHLITTSFLDPRGYESIDLLSEMDFAQEHLYSTADAAADMAIYPPRKQVVRVKPHFYGELGLSGDGKQQAELDPKGLHLHNALYACVGQQQAGAPLAWWWDSYIEPQNLYPLYRAFAGWIEGFDFVAQRARPLQGRLLYADKTGPRLRVLGLAGDTRALIWAQNSGHSWLRTVYHKQPAGKVSGARIELTGMKPGEWAIERWDTEAGRVTHSVLQTVKSDGRLTLVLPDITWDASYRLSVSSK